MPPLNANAFQNLMPGSQAGNSGIDALVKQSGKDDSSAYIDAIREASEQAKARAAIPQTDLSSIRSMSATLQALANQLAPQRLLNSATPRGPQMMSAPPNNLVRGTASRTSYINGHFRSTPRIR